MAALEKAPVAKENISADDLLDWSGRGLFVPGGVARVPRTAREKALVAKENMSPAEADALDWQEYNKKKLVVGRAKELRDYERRNYKFQTLYDGNLVLATETNSYKTNGPKNGIIDWTSAKYFYNEGLIGVEPLDGTVVRDGKGGARLSELSFVPTALLDRPGLRRPGLQGCNTRNEPWPSAVITIGVARTLPELIDDSKYYFTDPSSRINFCLGIKVYCPTQQMVAFLRERRHPDNSVGGGTTLTWALSFGTAPIGQSSIDVLAREGIGQVLGLGSPGCTGPGIEAFKLVLNKERFFAAFEPDTASELVQHMEQDVELDFHDVQQWCLRGLTGDWELGRRPTQEEEERAYQGGMLGPEIEIKVPAPIKVPGGATKDMREKARRGTQGAGAASKRKARERTGADGPSKSTRSKMVKKVKK